MKTAFRLLSERRFGYAGELTNDIFLVEYFWCSMLVYSFHQREGE